MPSRVSCNAVLREYFPSHHIFVLDVGGEGSLASAEKMTAVLRSQTRDLLQLYVSKASNRCSQSPSQIVLYEAIHSKQYGTDWLENGQVIAKSSLRWHSYKGCSALGREG